MTSAPYMAARHHGAVSGPAEAAVERLDGGRRPTSSPVPSTQFLFRRALLPLQTLDVLAGNLCDARLSQRAAISARLRADREAISRVLHQAIGSACDRQTRNALIELRRELFNGRPGRQAALAIIQRELNESEAARVIAYREDVSAYKDSLEALRMDFAIDLSRSRAGLAAAIRNDDFRRGLALSSEALFAALRQYQRLSTAPSRDAQIERGILKYFTRAAAKATPFASFCLIGTDSTNKTNGTHTPTATSQHFRSTRLNKRILADISSALIRDKDLRAQLTIELNHTLIKEEHAYRFLSRFGGREFFHRLARSPAVDLVVEGVGEDGGTVAAVVRRLASHPRLETSEEDALVYVNRLLDVGFVRFRPLVRDDDPAWALSIATALKNGADPRTEPIVSLLERLVELERLYQAADAGTAFELLRDGKERMRDVYESFVGSPPPPANVLYEDFATSARLSNGESGDYEQALSAFGEFIGATSRAAWPRGELATLRHFFERHHSRDARVPLLQFFEHAYRDFLRGVNTQERAARLGAVVSNPVDVGNPFSLPSISRVRAGMSRITELFRKAWSLAPPGATSVAIALQDVRDALADIPPVSPPMSAAAFAQLAPTTSDGISRIVAPSGRYHSGFGRYVSRFLDLVPDLCSFVRNDNSSFRGVWLAEITGDQAFNGNLHPELLPFRIGHPEDRRDDSEHAIACSDLAVVLDEYDEMALQLVHLPTGHRVVPIEIGILNPTMRSPLHRFLTKFQPPASLELPLPEALSMGGADRSGLVHRPRLLVGEYIVVARETWFVPGAEMPRRQTGDDGPVYMARLADWRTEHAIPLRVYARIRPRRFGGAGKVLVAPDGALDETHDESDDLDADTPTSELAKRTRGTRGASQDHYKPQYIDFSSPLLVDTFSRLPGAATDFVLVIEEQYPVPVDGGPSGETAHVTEWVFHWNWFSEQQRT